MLSTSLLVAVLAQSASASDEPLALEAATTSVAPEARTQVLVLGTDHLAGVEGFQREQLAELLDLLEDFAPTAICVERLPGRTIGAMQAAAGDFDAVLERFAGGLVRQGEAVRERHGWTRGQAEERVRTLLSELGPEPDVPERVRLAEAFLAAFDGASATLQYLRAGSPEEGLAEDQRDYLRGRARSANEVESLAVPLALRVGLDRIHAVDDHMDKDDYMRVIDAFVAELQESDEMKKIEAGAPLYNEASESIAAGVRTGNLLPHYRWLNSMDYGRRDIETQWDLFLRTRFPSGLDGTRLALWEVRNLNIASNVRRVTAGDPGGRCLVLIGASHKPFLDAHLARGLDLRVVQLEALIPD